MNVSTLEKVKSPTYIIYNFNQIRIFFATDTIKKMFKKKYYNHFLF